VAPIGVSAPAEIAGSPRVAVNARGDAVVVWERLTGPNAVLEAAARPAGGVFGAPVVVSAPGVNAFSPPQVAIDGAGDAVAVWLWFNGTNYIVQASTRSGASGAWGKPVDLSAAGRDAATPQVAVDQAGDVVVVWERSDGRTYAVQAASRAAGGSFEAPVQLSAPGRGAVSPQVAVDGVGNAVAAWARFDGTNYIVQSATGRAASGVWQEPVDVSAADVDALTPNLAVGPAGDVLLVWVRFHLVSSGGVTFSQNVVQAAVRRVGGRFDVPVELSAIGQGAALPQAAVDRAGGAVVVWCCGVTGGKQTLQAATLGAASPAWRTIDLPAVGQSPPQIAVDPAGDAVVVWDRFNPFSQGPSYSVQAITRRAGGRKWQELVDVSPATMMEAAPQLAVDQHGDAVAVWYGPSGVQAAGYDFAGPQLRRLSIPGFGTARTRVSFAVSPLDVWSGVAVTRWRFGDGHTATGRTVRHVYAKPGIYHVLVASTDHNGNTTTARQTINIRVRR
jgi:hypothetical protein